MTKAVLLTFFTLCFSRGSHVVAATSESLRCSPGETTTNNVDHVGTFEVVCPTGTTVDPVVPGDLSFDAGVYRTPNRETDNDVNNCAPISHVLPGACLGQKEGKNVVGISQLPKEATAFYLHCTRNGALPQDNNAQSNDCVIEVVVAASRRLGPNTCSVGGSRVLLDIQKANETAVFLCGEGRALRPDDFAQKAFKENCTDEVKLPDKVKVTHVDKAYRVTVPELPKEKTTLCYVCEKTEKPETGDKRHQGRCEVTISIAASNASGALAAGVVARAAAAAGLTVAVLRAW